jgi:hypothetical protein
MYIRAKGNDYKSSTNQPKQTPHPELEEDERILSATNSERTGLPNSRNLKYLTRSVSELKWPIFSSLQHF